MDAEQAEFVFTRPAYAPTFDLCTIRLKGKDWTPGVHLLANDLVSSQIRRTGAWEPWETEVMRDILECTDIPGIFVDVGAHIGYYSFLGALCGRRVYSFDCCPLYEEAYRRTLDAHPILARKLHLIHGDLRETPKLVVPSDEIALWKMDIEGLEPEVAEANMALFTSRKVAFAIFEITPEKRDNSVYRALIQRITACGYRAVDIGISHPRELSARSHPLATILKHLRDGGATFTGDTSTRDVVTILPQEGPVLMPTHQWNCLFIRQDTPLTPPFTELLERMRMASGPHMRENSHPELPYATYHFPNFTVTPGMRDTLVRMREFEVPADVSLWSFLDLGSCLGSLSLEMARRGAQNVLGLEGLASRVELSQELATMLELPPTVRFQVFDITSWMAAPERWGTWDYVWACSIDAYIEDKERLYETCAKVAKRGVLFESNVERTDAAHLAILHKYFPYVKAIGMSKSDAGWSRRSFLCGKRPKFWE